MKSFILGGGVMIFGTLALMLASRVGYYAGVAPLVTALAGAWGLGWLDSKPLDTDAPEVVE